MQQPVDKLLNWKRTNFSATWEEEGKTLSSFLGFYSPNLLSSKVLVYRLVLLVIICKVSTAFKKFLKKYSSKIPFRSPSSSSMPVSLGGEHIFASSISRVRNILHLHV